MGWVFKSELETFPYLDFEASMALILLSGFGHGTILGGDRVWHISGGASAIWKEHSFWSLDVKDGSVYVCGGRERW